MLTYSAVCAAQKEQHIRVQRKIISMSICTTGDQTGYCFVATLRNFKESWGTTSGGAEPRRDGWVGRRRCHCTDTWMTKENTARLGFKQNVYEKLIQARAIWHTQTKVAATRQIQLLTGDWSSESSLKWSHIFLTPYIPISLCWWTGHFLRDSGWVQLEQMPPWPPPPPQVRDTSIFWNHPVRGPNQSIFFPPRYVSCPLILGGFLGVTS